MKNLRRFLSCLLAVTMLLALGVTASAAEFTDVPAGSDYAEAVQWASDNGYIYGYGDGRFGVNDNVTRAQLATIFHRAAGTPAASGTSRFSDAEAGAYYINALSWAETAGLIAGYPDGRFGVGDPVTRQQVATILWRWAGSPAASAGNYSDENAISAYAQTAVDWSRSNGNTEAVANAIADTLDADLFEMVPEAPYTSADLNWTDSSSRVNAEHNDPSKQDVKLAKNTVDNWTDYDTVFIGYPIWWGIAAWPVNDFVKNNDFTGKTVIPFCTSTSSGLGQSGTLLAEMANGGNWQEGRRFTERASQSDIAAWANGLDLPKANTQPTQSGESKVLVAYFSMPETTNPNNMTTEEATSTVVINGEVLGNTQYMAQVIQRTTNADIYRIEPQNPYPTDHTTLVAQAREEQDQDTRPAIKDAISDFDSYDTVFIGYPIWWSDLPQILYTFFDTYDFSGKTVIPFSTHGGSSFAGTPATIQSLEPGAKMLDGLTISRNNIQDAEQEIVSWVNGLDY